MPVTAIAYLAPEIPARSATFVYREAQALEAAGCRICYFGVRAAQDRAGPSAGALGQVEVLYQGSTLRRLARALPLVLAAMLGWPAARAALPGWRNALAALASDLREPSRQRFGRLKLIHQWLTAALLGRRLREQRIEHLHVHFCHVPGTIGMYAGLFTGLPWTVVAHANDVHVRAALLPQKALRSQRLIAVSEAMRSELLRRGVPAAQVQVIRCGTLTAPSPAALDASTPDSVPTSPPWVLGGLGRLVEKKGFDDLLRVAASLRAEGLDVHVRVAGEGPERGRMEALAGELGLGTALRMDGALDPGDVGAWLRGLALFVLPCRRAADGDMDGIPVVLMEAMAAGVPVLSTRLSGIPELVRDGETGLLAEPGDVAGLTTAARRLLQDANLRGRLIRGAHAHIAAEFDLQRNAHRLLAVIREAA